jgi:protein MAK11
MSTRRLGYRYSFEQFLISLKDLALLHTLEHSSRIHDVKFAQRVDGEGEVVLVAAEDKKTTVYEVSPDSGTFLHAIAYLVGHGNRYVP